MESLQERNSFVVVVLDIFSQAKCGNCSDPSPPQTPICRETLQENLMVASKHTHVSCRSSLDPSNSRRPQHGISSKVSNLNEFKASLHGLGTFHSPSWGWLIFGPKPLLSSITHIPQLSCWYPRISILSDRFRSFFWMANHGIETMIPTSHIFQGVIQIIAWYLTLWI